MVRSRERFDPELTAESKMSRMRDEMETLRMTVISLSREPYRSIIEPPYDLTQAQSRDWLATTSNRVIELTGPDSHGKAACPLFGAVSQFVGSEGFTYPDGLDRHLTGSHNAHQCPILYAANGLRRVRHREQFPNDYGPYGCD
jgi:hypothetical protein